MRIVPPVQASARGSMAGAASVAVCAAAGFLRGNRALRIASAVSSGEARAPEAARTGPVVARAALTATADAAEAATADTRGAAAGAGGAGPVSAGPAAAGAGGAWAGGAETAGAVGAG